MFTSTAFASILPEILILIIGILVLIVEPFWKEEQRRNVGWLTAGGLFAAMIISFLLGQPGQPRGEGEHLGPGSGRSRGRVDELQQGPRVRLHRA